MLVAGNPDASPVKMSGNKTYYEEVAKRCKAEIGVPIMLAGDVRSLREAQRLVDEGITDYVSLARPLIREPDLIRRWAAGNTMDSGCLSDNECLIEGLKGNGVHCVHLDV